MFGKIIFALAAFFASMSFAFAAVDVNKADQSQLESIKGIGPTTAQKIIDERKKSPFKDWQDFEARVKGVGDANSAKFSGAGLTVNGQAKADALMKADTKKDSMSKGKSATDTVKSAASTAAATTEKAAGDVKKGARNTAAKVEDKTGDAVDAVKSGASKAKAATVEKVGDAKDAMKADASKAKSKANAMKEDTTGK